VSKAMFASGLLRAHVPAASAWTIHCPDHSSAWQAELPRIIERVEKGEFPAEQAGLYDLQLAFWEQGRR